MSYVIDPVQIGDLPLSGRDVYTMLVSLPGVSANNGTGRGLGISVAGQRPSASNFLLDGVENNNYLVTGPLNPVAPEAVQEYRISTNNYSAEYGRTAGFVANAITRAGGAAYHGIAYEYLKNEAFNAADFADNLIGYGRRKAKENQFGYQAGGPILKNRLFFSSALEELISHSVQNPQTYAVPTSNFIDALNLPADRLARQLLEKYPGPKIVSKAIIANFTAAAPVIVDRLVALERADYAPANGKDRFMARLNIARLTQPDFIWSPYPDFISPLYQHTTGAAGNWMRTWAPRVTSETKISFSNDTLWWDRAHPEIPTLASGDGALLPGSPAFYSYRNHNRSLEALYSMVWTRNKHVITGGAGMLFRSNDGFLTAGRDGEYIFPSVLSFAFDRPQYFRATINRLDAKPTQPNFDRNYGYAQSFFFLQDSFRVSARLTLNFGMRYERFGAPKNKGATKDALIVFGQGNNFNQRLAAATFAVPGAGEQQLYGADNADFAPRFGFSWDPLGKSKTILHGAYGMFYDRPFDNLWQNNRSNGLLLPFYSVTGTGTTNYLRPVASVLPSYANQSPGSDFPALTLMDPSLKNGYSQSFFLGVQQSIGENLTLEINGMGSAGRRLLTTDLVNRQFTTLEGDGRPNEALPDVSWRSSQGISNWTALATLVRYRFRTLQVQGSYTWSHAIDNQSDPLTGDFFDLNFTTINDSSGIALRSAFAQQFNSRGDRGNSDFDQRHNFFVLGTWQSDFRGPLTRGWQFSWMAAFRTGFPYSILTATTQAPDFGSGVIQNQRADLKNPADAFLATPRLAPGGLYILNPKAFTEPDSASVVGTTGRNAFRGPGLYNADVSLSRTFSLPKLPEGSRLTIRADAFNVLNHANLNNPDNLVGSKTFGLETFGRQGTASGFPAVSPLNESARTMQMLLRIEF